METIDLPVEQGEMRSISDVGHRISEIEYKEPERLSHVPCYILVIGISLFSVLELLFRINS